MSELRLERLTAVPGGRRGAPPAVRDATLGVRPKELVALLGPNGAGKTTLLRAALGLIPREGGSVRLGGDDPARLSPRERALRAAYLPQRRPLEWPNRVRDLVALGRFAHGGAPGRLGSADAAAVERALDDCGLRVLADRAADTLSGGELARVHCARVFAAGTPLLLADEPTAELDPLHQHRVLALIRRFVDDGGGALIVLHEISLAARYADRLVWMRDGEVLADGPPRAALTSEAVAACYGVEADVTWRNGRPVVDLGGPLPEAAGADDPSPDGRGRAPGEAPTAG